MMNANSKFDIAPRLPALASPSRRGQARPWLSSANGCDLVKTPRCTGGGWPAPSPACRNAPRLGAVSLVDLGRKQVRCLNQRGAVTRPPANGGNVHAPPIMRPLRPSRAVHYFRSADISLRGPRAVHFFSKRRSLRRPLRRPRGVVVLWRRSQKAAPARRRGAVCRDVDQRDLRFIFGVRGKAERAGAHAVSNGYDTFPHGQQV